MIKYTMFGPSGHEEKEVDENEALKMINEGLKKGKYIIVEGEDGEIITNNDTIPSKDEFDEKTDKKEKKRFRDKVKEKMQKGVKSVKEIRPIGGG